MDKQSIIKKINTYWHKEGHLNENQRDYLIGILGSRKPKYCLEIGFATGRSTVTTLYAADPVRLVSIDLNLDYMKAREFARELLDKFPNLIIIESDSSKILYYHFFKDQFPYGVDFAFVDGGHSFECCYSDISKIWPSLNKGGLMIIDDYESGKPDGCTLLGVNNAVNKFVDEHKLPLQKWNKNGKGFAILIK